LKSKKSPGTVPLTGKGGKGQQGQGRERNKGPSSRKKAN